ncbi:hypothetical protein C7A12_29470 [Pseudomonas fluorescens]|nr:hypothetical protein C7A12_29470 [Pseudomonas fluorescens]PRW71371.1 hypothetical protein C7A13_29680 [Pseudomonas fluorescens]RQO53083.1 hypothetical protein DBR46_18045 [Pseudomonas sp. KBW05]
MLLPQGIDTLCILSEPFKASVRCTAQKLAIVFIKKTDAKTVRKTFQALCKRIATHQRCFNSQRTNRIIKAGRQQRQALRLIRLVWCKIELQLALLTCGEDKFFARFDHERWAIRAFYNPKTTTERCNVLKQFGLHYG